MFEAQAPSGHQPPNFWIRIGAFNLAMAVTAGAFFGLGLRALLLAWMDRECGSSARTLRIVKGAVFLALGCYYTVVTWPMLIWDRPARIVVMITALAPPIVAGIRCSRGGLRAAPMLASRILAGFLTLILFVTAALTLLRAGFITLKGDRVAMLLAVTGETRTVKVNVSQIAGGRLEDMTEHHVILLLPEGVPAADVWIQGDRVAFVGEAVLFAPGLNAIGFPNLYRIDGVVHGGIPDGVTIQPSDFVPLPHIGPLAQRPSWALYRDAMLIVWPRADQDGSPWWGIRTFMNHSPNYPLVNPDGTPLKKDFLFDITLDGIPTSRFTSPLEKR